MWLCVRPPNSIAKPVAPRPRAGLRAFSTLLEPSVTQFTVSVTVAWLVVALLGAAPVWSAPVRVNV